MENEAKREVLKILSDKEREMNAKIERIGNEVRELQKNDRRQDKEIDWIKITLEHIQSEITEMSCRIKEIVDSIKVIPVMLATLTRVDKTMSKTFWIVLGCAITYIFTLLGRS